MSTANGAGARERLRLSRRGWSVIAGGLLSVVLAVLGSLLVVDEKKLMALPDATVLSLFRAGEMHLVSMHLASLSNMQALVDRVAHRGAPMQPPPKPPKKG